MYDFISDSIYYVYVFENLYMYFRVSNYASFSFAFGF